MVYKVLSDGKGNKEEFSVKILHHVQSVLHHEASE